MADFGFFLVAGLVALRDFAAALRAAGLFAVFMVLAAAVLVSGAAALDTAALGAVAFFAAGFASDAAGLAALAGAAFVLAAAVFVVAVLVEPRTAMACARGRFVVLSSFIRDAFLDGVT